MTTKEISIDLNELMMCFYEDGEWIGGAAYSKEYYTVDEMLARVVENIKEQYGRLVPNHYHVTRENEDSYR